MEGLDAGPVRAPLIMPSPEDLAELGRDHRGGPRSDRRRAGSRALMAAGSDPHHAARASPPSRSSTRRCSTPSACTSRSRCARSSSWTPTPGWSGLGETYADTSAPGAPDRPPPRRSPAWTCSRSTPFAPRSPSGFAVTTPRCGTAGMITTASAVDQVFSPFEVACLDVQGHATGTAGVRPARRQGPRHGALQRLPVLQVGRTSRRASPMPGARRSTRPGIVAQAKRMIGEYGFTAIKLKGGVFPPEEEMKAIEALREALPRPPAATRPQCRVDAADLGQGGRRACGRPRVSGGPDARPRRHGGGGRAVADAAGDQHVRRRVRPAGARDRASSRSSVVLSDHHYWGGLQRSRLLAGICGTFGLGAVHALQLAPGHQPGRDGPPGRRHPEPHLRVRHALAVEDRGGGQAGCPRDSRTGPSRCRPRRALASNSTTTRSAHCTSSTSGAGSATATTPATCRASIPDYTAISPRW